MKHHLSKRFLCAALALFFLCSVLSSCSAAKNDKNSEKKNAYEESVPALFSDKSGVGRGNPGRHDDIDQQDSTGRTICIDAGHGFVDGGCGEGYYSDGTVEKDITLAIALKLNERLKLLGYNTVMTHDGENIPSADTNGNKIFSASERVAYINTLKIDYLISIHVNALDSDTSVAGMHIYYQQSSTKLNTWGEKLSKYISESIGEKVDGQSDPIVKDGTDPNTSFALTRDVKAASSLLEVGFVTNETDAQNMVDPDWQQDVANAVADGIDRFFKELDGEQK